jgi:hypothetical protein
MTVSPSVTQFFTDFWPNLTSTVVGVLIGVPFALKLNRHAIEHTEEARRKAEREAVAHTLRVIRASITHNLVHLEQLQAALKRQETLFDTRLDSSAWPVLRAGLTAELKEPMLRQQLAQFFVRLDGIIALNERLLALVTTTAGSISTAEAVRVRLLAALTQAIAELLNGAKDLALLAETVAARLAA